MQITNDTSVTSVATSSTELTINSISPIDENQSSLGHRRQFQEEISEMLSRQDLFPLVNEKVVDFRLMNILNFVVSPTDALTRADRRMLAKYMKCSLCDTVPPPLPKHCRFGHWTCNKCVGKTPTCPYETLGFDNDANCNQPVNLEWDIERYTKIYNKLKVFCKNSKFGCHAKIRTVHIKKHEKRCHFRQMEGASASLIIRVVYDPNLSPIMYTVLETTPSVLHLFGKHVVLSAYQKSTNIFLWLSYARKKENVKCFYTLEILDLHGKKKNKSAECLARKLSFSNLPVHHIQAEVDKTVKEKNCVMLSQSFIQPLVGKLKNVRIENYFLVKICPES